MGLQNTLYTGMSGLLAYQMAIDALANNTANVNATGYKKLTTTFADLLYSTVAPSQGGWNGVSATNPAAIGNGTLVAQQAHNFSQGGLESTGRTLDFAIDGNGFFVLDGGASGQYLSRNGNFYLARGLSGSQVDLLGDQGFPVRGYNAVNGVLQSAMTNISLPAIDTLQPGIATKTVEVSGNISSQNPLISGNAVTAADGWINASGQPIADILVGGVQTSSPLRDKSTGAAATAATRLIDLQLQNISDWQNLFNAPADADVDSRELAITFDRSGQTYVKTLTVTPQTTLKDLGDWLGGALGDDTQNTRDSSGALGLYSTRDYTVAGDGFELAGEQAGCFLSQIDGKTQFNIASNIGALNFIQDIQLTATSHMTLADGRQQNIIEDLTPFAENRNFPGSLTENPATIYDRKILAPDTFTMETVESLLHFVKLSEDDNSTTWRWYAENPGNYQDDPPTNTPLGVNSGVVRFDTVGAMLAAFADGNGGDQTLNFDFSKLTQMSDRDSAVGTPDGYLPGYLKTYSTALDGMIYGMYDNGQTMLLAQVGLAIVTNPSGMVGASGTMFQTTPSSGSTLYSAPGALPKQFGAVYGGFLELSNFQLGADAIIIQRSYQFSSRLITTANEMLQTVYNLKQ